MESLRVRKTLDIEVNDNGDIITIPVEDVQFLDGFYDLVDKFSNKGQEIKAKGTGMNQKEHIQLLVTVCRISQQRLIIYLEKIAVKRYLIPQHHPHTQLLISLIRCCLYLTVIQMRDKNALQISIAGRDRVAHLTRNMAVTARIEGRDRYVQCHAGQAAI